MTSVATICLALQGKKSIEVSGVSIESLDDLVPVLQKCTIKEIDELLRNDSFSAWLNRLGYEKEVRTMKEGMT